MKKHMEKAFLQIFDDILGSVREPLVVLNVDFRVVKANQAFFTIFDVNPDDTEGTIIYELANHQWDIPRLRELLETILPQNTVFKDFEVEHTFDDIGFKLLHLNARRIYNKENEASLILLSIEDVTEREYYKRNLEEVVVEFGPDRVGAGCDRRC